MYTTDAGLALGPVLAYSIGGTERMGALYLGITAALAVAVASHWVSQRWRV